MTVVESGTEQGMFVDGAFVAGDGLGWTQVCDPATGEEVGKAPQAGAAEVELAVQAAARAFPGWSELPAATRGEVLRAAAERVHEEVEPLALLLTREQGKPLREARLELNRFVHTIEHYAGLAKAIRGGYVPALDERAHGLILRRPLGVVVAVVPWNFPTTLLANKLGPALLTGNTVVAKPAETTPLTTLRIAALMHEAGVPAGAFNVVTGKGSELGPLLVRHPLVRKVGVHGLDAGGTAGDGARRRGDEAPDARARRLGSDDHLRRRRSRCAP